MPTIIVLTRLNGQKIFFNADCIYKFTEDVDGRTTIFDKDSDYFDVLESPEEVYALIELRIKNNNSMK